MNDGQDLLLKRLRQAQQEPKTVVRIDAVFLVDRSYSMGPCLEALKEHIKDFAAGLARSPYFSSVDYRIGLLGQTAVGAGGDYDILYPTSDLARFAKVVDRLKVGGDEFTLPALDRCLDFPWREDARRFILLLSDEPVSTGSNPSFQRSKLQELLTKAMTLGVATYVVAPECEEFRALSTLRRSQGFFITSHADFFRQDFARYLETLGRMVSSSSGAFNPKTGKVTADLYGLRGKAKERIH